MAASDAGRGAQLGAVFAQDEIGTRPSDVQNYARALEELGLTHVVVADHVVGLDTRHHDLEAPYGRPSPYTIENRFFEPFVLFGYLAAVTSSLELMTAVLVLPQRQPVLAAKQAATVDVLCDGRLRLGVGVGYIAGEFEALGMPFPERGARLDEAITLMRRLWCEETVTSKGLFHDLHDVGIVPPPVQRPIPVWFGTASAPRALERVGRSGDGWLPLKVPGFGFEADWDVVKAAADRAARPWESIGIEGRVQCRDRDVDRTRRQVERWQAGGATHVAIDTEQAGLEGWQAHIDLLAQILGR